MIMQFGWINRIAPDGVLDGAIASLSETTGEMKREDEGEE
jgi:hypothetical protein